MTFSTRHGITISGSDTASPAVIDLPATIVVGELLILNCGARAASLDTTLTGWTNFASSSGSFTHMVSFWRVADGTEGATVTLGLSVAARWSAAVYRFSNTADPTVQPPEATTAFQDSDNATKTPSALTPTGGAKDYTWITGFFHRNWGTVSTYPTSYINTTSYVSTPVDTVPNLTGWCDRNLNAASETPSTFTTSIAADWTTVTIAIHPAAAAGGTILPLMMSYT